VSDQKKKATLSQAEPQGRARGGIARAEKLSPERRTEIARNAARARYGTVLRATHKGNFKDDFGIDVDCFVLDDTQKSAVISQRGMGLALKLGEGGSRLPRFIRRQNVAPYVGPELAEKLSNPLIFQWSTPGPNVPPATVNGYDVTMLIDVCKSVIAAGADGKLLETQQNTLRQAHTIINASAKAGIKGLVYALAGYDATRAEVIAAFRFYVREEAREYEREFPDQLYQEWYRLYELPRPEKNRPWKFRALTIDHVYHPLAASSGKILQLTREKRASSDERHRKLHQFLSDIGVKRLRMHLGQLLGIAQVSDNRNEYENRVEKVFGTQLNWEF
jgi:hypothetical protein